MYKHISFYEYEAFLITHYILFLGSGLPCFIQFWNLLFHSLISLLITGFQQKVEKSNSERCKDYRETIKVKDPELYEHRRAHYVEQNQANRKIIKTPEQLERQRLLTKLPMHRLRYVNCDSH